ncbi:MAG TPA: galactokinase [Phycisphaerae bacterium]|nr:galactokinase [Phycisphaerae bacterium]HNU43974.1 galactokinase [Phycisphaerae bacterium]
MTPELAAARFSAHFGCQPECVVRAPGRVNLIGDHTDYTGGWVLPVAIDRALYVAAAAGDPAEVQVYSELLDEQVALPLSVSKAEEHAGSWSRYVIGVIALLREQGCELRGAKLWIGGDVAPGAGLSSSAALEVGTALALLEVAGLHVPRPQLAQLCRRAENEYAGSPCGIMDQLCCTCAQADHALLIDCTSLATTPVPLHLGDAQLVVLDTGVRHSIAGTEYATRRQECARALEIIGRTHPQVRCFRDLETLRAVPHGEQLGAILSKRVAHVVSENGRVRQAAEALGQGRLAEFGRLMFESHASLRDDYQVSCAELDDMVGVAGKTDGVYGARMTGGGFGGSVVALVASSAVEPFLDSLRRQYSEVHSQPFTAFTVHACGAATRIPF